MYNADVCITGLALYMVMFVRVYLENQELFQGFGEKISWTALYPVKKSEKNNALFL